MREFRLTISRHSDENSIGEQDFNAHLASRWQGMEVNEAMAESLSIPFPRGVTNGPRERIDEERTSPEHRQSVEHRI